jgi:hypothetical protein
VDKARKPESRGGAATTVDPVAFLIAPILLSGVALLAVWLLARRAGRA